MKKVKNKESETFAVVVDNLFAAILGIFFIVAGFRNIDSVYSWLGVSKEMSWPYYVMAIWPGPAGYYLMRLARRFYRPQRIQQKKRGR